MFNVFVTMVPKEVRVEEFQNTLGELLNAVRQEPGCADIIWGRVVDESKYAILERYLDEAVRTAHLSNPATKEYGPIIGELLAEAPKIVLFPDL